VTAFEKLVRRTPILRSAPLSERAGGDVWLKLECLQRTGSFKLRGAAMRLDAMGEEERARGVIAASAGNHGLGIALACRHLGVWTEIVAPATSPRVKRDAIAALGAEVVVKGASYDEAEVAARRRAHERGAVFVSPYDDEHVIRGNGFTVGEEIFADLPAIGQVVCPVGGGGLVGGLAMALAPRGARVVGVQPAGNCAMRRSLDLGRPLTEYQGEATLAEGCEGAIAERTYELARSHRVSVILVDERAIRRAVAYAYRELGVVIEPTAAVALAGVLENGVRPIPGAATVVLLTGGNVEPELLDQILADA
jgi:threonine dehydratase